MGAGHSHNHDTSLTNENALWCALALTSTFLIAELVGGILTKSLALISDAAHMFTDAAALAIALVAIKIAKRPADKIRSFGYYRFEILAAAFNALLLFGVAIYILLEAYERLKQPEGIQSTMMLIIAVIGLMINIISMRILNSGKENSLNVKGAYLEVWSDMLGSLGVIAGALLIRFTGKLWIDSAIAVGIGLWVLPRTWILLKESLNILLEGVPADIETDKIEKAILKTEGVESLHDLHIWSISNGKISLTVHIVLKKQFNDAITIMQIIRKMLVEKFHISHSTVQIERVACEQDKNHNYHLEHS